MNRIKANHILIGLLIICALTLSYFIYDQRKYDEVYALIDVNEMDAIEATYVQNDVVLFKIDASENASYIEINEDVTVVDNEKLFNILAKYESRRSRKDYFPFEEDSSMISISLSQNNRPKHIILGDFNIWYESSDDDAYEIIEGDKLIEEILELLASERQVSYDDFAFELLLGSTRSDVIRIFGKNYVETDQGVNQQNTGLDYDELGVLFGLDRKNDKVVEVQLKDVEYKGISTKLRMGEADEILDMEMLMINLNPTPIWYIYDFGSYKIRLSGQSRGSLIEALVIFTE